MLDEATIEQFKVALRGELIQQDDEGIKGPRATSSEKDRHRIHRGFIGVGEHCNDIALR
jgi:hypothetical protein